MQLWLLVREDQDTLSVGCTCLTYQHLSLSTKTVEYLVSNLSERGIGLGFLKLKVSGDRSVWMQKSQSVAFNHPVRV